MLTTIDILNTIYILYKTSTIAINAFIIYFVSYDAKIPVSVLVPGGIDYIPVPCGILFFPDLIPVPGRI